MAEVIVPRLGVAVTEVTIVDWLVEDGAEVEQGEAIVTVATDKTEVDIESTAGGTLRHGAEPEDVYAVGAVIGTID